MAYKLGSTGARSLKVLKPKDTVNAAAMLGMNRSSTVMCGTQNLGFMVSPGLNN